MNRLERKIKKYYQDKLDHTNSVEKIKETTGYFVHKEKKIFSFSKLALVPVMAVLVAVVAIPTAINAKKSSSVVPSNSIYFENTDIKKSVIVLNSDADFKISVDENNNVKSVKPINQEAKILLIEEDYSNKNYLEVIKDIITLEKNMGYLVNSSKYNNFKIEISSLDTNYQLSEIETNISDYFANENISFENDNFSIIKKPASDTFEDEYQDVDNYDEVEEANGIVIEFNELKNTLVEKIAKYQAILNNIEDNHFEKIVKSLVNKVEVYLDNYYANIIKESSSFQNKYRELIDEKITLLSLKDNEESYLNQLDHVEKCIASLLSWKDFILESLKIKLEIIDEEINALNEAYSLIVEDTVISEDDIENAKEEINEDLNLKYKEGKEKLYKFNKEIKSKLINKFNK